MSRGLLFYNVVVISVVCMHPFILFASVMCPSLSLDCTFINSHFFVVNCFPLPFSHIVATMYTSEFFICPCRVSNLAFRFITMGNVRLARQSEAHAALIPSVGLSIDLVMWLMN